jgi:hypothetical protein
MKSKQHLSAEISSIKIKQMRCQIKEYADLLSSDALQSAYDLLTDLVQKESEEATEELLSIPNLLEDIEMAEKDIAEGNLTDWREVRSDV